MKYPLDCESTVAKSYLFWLSRFVRSKVISLSNRNVKDKDRFTVLIQQLISGYSSMEALKTTIKELRMIGISGIHVYFIPLEKLFDFLNAFGAASLKEIDEEFLSDFLATNTTTLSDATKKNYRIALMNFFSYIDKQNEDDSSNSYRYDIELKNWGGLSGKSGEKLPAYLKKEEIERFLHTIDSFEFSQKIAARNRLIIKIILYTGIRVSEALSILQKDLIKDGEVYVIEVRGKGNKPRIVIIKQDIIEKDLQEYKDIKTDQSDLLFCNQNGKMLTQPYIYSIVEKLLFHSGIKKEKNGAHMLRHTFATMLYQKSKDLVLVQESLGHADINTSRIYTHFDKERLKKTTDIF